MCKLGRICYRDFRVGIYKLGGVDFDTLTKEDIARLDQFMVSQNGYEKEDF